MHRELVVDDNFARTNIGMLMTAQCHQSQGILLVSRAVYPRELRGMLDLTTARFSIRPAEIMSLASPRAGPAPGKLHQRAGGGQTRRYKVNATFDHRPGDQGGGRPGLVPLGVSHIELPESYDG